MPETDHDARAGRGTVVADVGRGPSHAAAHLAAQDADVLGPDISARVVAEARRLHPAPRFERADMLRLGDHARGRFAAAVAFYPLVHLDGAALAGTLASLRVTVPPGGDLLAAVHLGEGRLRPRRHVERAGLRGIPAVPRGSWRMRY